jgi:3-oxo-5-alpha-steroid 4-dehydrogenase 1
MIGDSSWIFPIFCGWALVAGLIFLSLFGIVAPYGRHRRGGWGPEIPARLGWVIMEAPSPLIILGLFIASGRDDLLSTMVVALWVFHYTYRSFLYPFWAKMGGKKMPLSVAVMAIVFNLMNAGFNGMAMFYWLPPSSLSLETFGPLQWGALLLFVTGFVIHFHSDRVLWGLRSDGSSGYKIPMKGLHRWVASPNYFGECIQWLGLALFANNLACWSFWLWTVGNLAPRARSNLSWYREQFSDYPRERKGLLPFIW